MLRLSAAILQINRSRDERRTRPSPQTRSQTLEDLVMKKWLLALSLTASTLAFTQSSSSPEDLDTLHGRPEPPMLGIHWARGFDPLTRSREAQAGATTVKSANMLYHSGKIMPTAVSKNVFWGPNWIHSSFAGDKIRGLDAWYTGFSGSNYSKTSDEYTGTNGRVAAATLNQGHVIDSSTAANGSSPSAILAEVCRQVSIHNITLDTNGNGYYPVYVDVKRGTRISQLWDLQWPAGAVCIFLQPR